MTASPGDGEHAAREGYYPDPSIPGYVRYWNGAAWVPGTSRPAANPGPAASPVPAASPAPVPPAEPVVPATRVAPVGPVGPVAPVAPPAQVAPPAPADATGPVFLDKTSMTEALPESAAEPVVWQADPLHQAGFGGPRDRRVSWGGPAEPADAPGAGISLARTAEAAAAPAPGQAAAEAPAPGQAAAEAPVPVQRFPAQPVEGILSARSPAARYPVADAPVVPAAEWPEAPGGSGSGSGYTTSWPAQAPAPAPPAPAPLAPAPPAPAPAAPRPDEDRPARPEPATRRPDEVRPGIPEVPDRSAAPRPEVWQPRPAGVRPSVPRPEADGAAADRAAEPAAGGTRSWTPGSEEGREGSRAARAGTPREVFERMARRAVRPAGLPRRALARALDSLVLAAVAAGAALPLVPAAGAHLQAKVDAARSSGRTTTVWLVDGTVAGQLGLVLAAVLLFGVLYEVLPTARWGRTPGKKLCGVRVLSTATLRPPTFGAALLRWLVYAFLGLPGSLWCLVDRPRRQAWHDKAAKTYVAR
ncbi:RDD family protein [Streptomyces sp. NPDC055254]